MLWLQRWFSYTTAEIRDSVGEYIQRKTEEVMTYPCDVLS